MFWVYLNDRSAISNREGNSLQLDVIFAILMVSGMTQLVSDLTTDMQGDNGTVIYEHEYLAGMATHTRQ